MPVVQLAVHDKSSTLYGRSYGRTVVHPIFFGLMGYYYFVIIMGLRFASSANIYACLVCFSRVGELFSAFFLPLFFLSFL